MFPPFPFPVFKMFVFIAFLLKRLSPLFNPTRPLFGFVTNFSLTLLLTLPFRFIFFNTSCYVFLAQSPCSHSVLVSPSSFFDRFFFLRFLYFSDVSSPKTSSSEFFLFSGFLIPPLPPVVFSKTFLRFSPPQALAPLFFSFSTNSDLFCCPSCHFPPPPPQVTHSVRVQTRGPLVPPPFIKSVLNILVEKSQVNFKSTLFVWSSFFLFHPPSVIGLSSFSDSLIFFLSIERTSVWSWNSSVSALFPFSLTLLL